jgi:hypothetical protein
MVSRGGETPTVATLGVLGVFERWQDDDAVLRIQRHLHEDNRSDLTERLTARWISHRKPGG